MKKILSPILILFFTFSLSSNNITHTKSTVLYDECTVAMSVDCDGDGIPEMSSIVYCEHVDAMEEFMLNICENY